MSKVDKQFLQSKILKKRVLCAKWKTTQLNKSNHQKDKTSSSSTSGNRSAAPLSLSLCISKRILLVMGGCCCSTRKAHLNGAPVYYYYPPSLEEHESLTSHDATAAAISSGFLVDLQLEASIPDNFRPPPPPLPYDAVSRSLPIGTNSVREPACLDHMEPDYKVQSTAPLGSPKSIAISKSNDVNVSVADEEDVCPICLEEYDEDNPTFITKCEHHFHLSCILAWMERSDVCPICDKIMEFDNSFDL